MGRWTGFVVFEMYCSRFWLCTRIRFELGNEDLLIAFRCEGERCLEKIIVDDLRWRQCLCRCTRILEYQLLFWVAGLNSRNTRVNSSFDTKEGRGGLEASWVSFGCFVFPSFTRNLDTSFKFLNPGVFECKEGLNPVFKFKFEPLNSV